MFSTYSRSGQYWELNVDEYPYCCGIHIICDFPDGNIEVTKEIRNDIEKELAYRTSKRKDSCGVFHITLNSQQNKEFGNLIKEYGFKMKQRFYNPNSQNFVYFYTCTNLPPKKRAKKIFDRV